MDLSYLGCICLSSSCSLAVSPEQIPGGKAGNTEVMSIFNDSDIHYNSKKWYLGFDIQLASIPERQEECKGETFRSAASHLSPAFQK